MIDPMPGDIFRKGQVLNNTYEIEGVLGRGGTGEVYRARNQITGRVVAVKALNRLFSSNDAYIELIRREEEMRNILHDAVVRYTDCSRTDQHEVFLVMDFVDGTPLSDRLERGGIDPRDLLIVAHRVAEGLVATHARRIVHRDLSPDNIILRGDEPSEAVIIDFGIAKDASAGARTIVGNDFAGKYEYAAPEQLHGHAEPRSDLYALGAALLATFRGRVPDVGGAPGAVTKNKDKPLDTSGVPEPLKTLIDDLTQPDPARRPPNAQAVVDAIDRMLHPPPSPDGTRCLWPVLLPLAIAASAAALWLSDAIEYVFPTPLPVAVPYTIVAERPASGAASLSGHAPDAASRAALLDSFAAATGARLADDAITLAAGAPEGWSDTAAALIAVAAPLQDWRLSVSDRDAALSGIAPDRSTRDTVAEAFRAAATTAGITPSVEIAAGPVELTPEAVRALLATHADCGQLAPVAPETATFPLGATVAIAGRVAAHATVEEIRTALTLAIGDRSLRADLSVLNPELCTVLALLPPTPSGPISIALRYGDERGPNLSGVYAVGDNPVVDILVPASLTAGHLWVAIADVTGNLFNILPNIKRPEDALAKLGESADGMRRIRVAYSLDERAEDGRRLAFTIDENFGKSVVIVFHTDRALFPELRPTKESVATFAEEFNRVLTARSVEIFSIATQFIESRN